MELHNQFEEIRVLISSARERTFKAVNKELIDLYWSIGQYISQKVSSEVWGKSVVENLSNYIREKEPNIKGFSRQNLWRMKQFYETYCQNEKLSPLVREISWSNNLLVLAKSNKPEELEFYLNLAVKEKYSKRELERQIDSGLFERVMLSNQKLSPVAREIHPSISDVFRDTYVLDFLDLPSTHLEKDLRKGIVSKLTKILQIIPWFYPETFFILTWYY